MSAKTKKKAQEKATKANKPTPKSPAIRIGKNILILLGAYLLLQGLKEYYPGYNWVLETLVKQNLEVQKSNKRLTPQQKLEAKVGFTAKYFDFINQNTPEDAIILMPTDSVLANEIKSKSLSPYIKTRAWTNYFVYPRKLVYEDQKDDFPEIYKKATHIAIVNFWGYSKLSYPVKNKSKYTVLPLK